MNAETLTFKLEKNGISTVDIINKLIEKEIITPERFPHLFDGDEFLMTLNSNKIEKGYHTYCPEPPTRHKQDNGDSFYLTKHRSTCFGGCGTLNLFQLTVYFISGEISIEEAQDSSLNKAERTQAKIFLAGHFPELGINPKSLTNPEGYKWDRKKLVLFAAANYYHYNGTETIHKDKLKNFYLEERWLKHSKKPYEELLEECKFGITPKGKYDAKKKRTTYNSLYTFLSKTKNFSDKDILDAGVCIRVDSGEIIDFFRNHAIIPYFYKGEVIGLYGRSLDPNCPKGRRHLRLSGTVEIPSSLDDVLKSKEALLCEGENTKVAIKACGFDNVMETRGSNGLKQPHFDLLEKHRNYNPEILQTVYLVFDPDEAGRKATIKVGQKLLEKNIKVMVVRIPPIHLKENIDGEIKETIVYPDVNDLFRYYGEKAPEIFRTYVDEAISFDAFNLLYNLEKEKITDLAEGRMALKRNAKYLNAIPRLERFFIVTEVINYLLPSFQDSVLPKEDIVDILRDLVINAPEITSVAIEPVQIENQTEKVEQTIETVAEKVQKEEEKQNSPQLEPIVGLKNFKKYEEELTENNIIEESVLFLTKNEEVFWELTDSIPNLVLVRDTTVIEQRIRNATATRKFNIVFDQHFETQELLPYLEMEEVDAKKGTFISKEKGMLSIYKPTELKNIV